MNDIANALISGCMALLGVALSSHLAWVSERKKQKEDTKRYIRQKKEDVYCLISEFILSETTNLDNKMLINYKRISTEELEKNIQIMMNLYVPQTVCRQFRKTVEAINGDLPEPIVQARLEQLRTIIREDIGLVD